MHYAGKPGSGRVYYASTSRRLVDDVAQLLLRFNVFSADQGVRKAGYKDGWHLHVTGAENQQRFLEDVGVHGARSVQARAALASTLESVQANTNLDTVPAQVWGRVKEVLAERR